MADRQYRVTGDWVIISQPSMTGDIVLMAPVQVCCGELLPEGVAADLIQRYLERGLIEEEPHENRVE